MYLQALENVRTVREELIHKEEEKMGTTTGAMQRASSALRPAIEYSNLTLSHSRLRHPELAWRHTIALLLAHSGFEGDNVIYFPSFICTVPIM